jgi:hypothetical protein
LAALSIAGFETDRAIEFGIEHCFVGFLPKPDVSIDDQAFADWHHLREVHPSSVKRLLEDI